MQINDIAYMAQVCYGFSSSGLGVETENLCWAVVTRPELAAMILSEAEQKLPTPRVSRAVRSGAISPLELIRGCGQGSVVGPCWTIYAPSGVTRSYKVQHHGGRCPIRFYKLQAIHKQPKR